MEKPSDGLKKGAWSEEEDNKLSAYIQRYGHWNWRLLPKFAGLSRCGKSCRLRWINYLKPGLKRGNFSEKEVNMIIELHAEHGNKWSTIAAKLPGRTDNEIKNFWNTHLRKSQEDINSEHTNTTEKSYEDQELNKDKSNDSNLYETGQDETIFLDGQASSLHTIPPAFSVTEPSQVDPWPDMFLADTSASADGHIDYYPPLPNEEYFFYPEFIFGDSLSWGDPSYSSAQPSIPPEEVGEVYDPDYAYFDHGTDLFSYQK